MCWRGGHSMTGLTAANTEGDIARPCVLANPVGSISVAPLVRPSFFPIELGKKRWLTFPSQWLVTEPTLTRCFTRLHFDAEFTCETGSPKRTVSKVTIVTGIWCLAPKRYQNPRFWPQSACDMHPDAWELPPHAIFYYRIPLAKMIYAASRRRFKSRISLPLLNCTFPHLRPQNPLISSGMRVWHLRTGYETGHEHAWSHGSRFYACLVPALNPADREVFIGGKFFCVPFLPSMFLCLLHLGAAKIAFGFWIRKFLVKSLFFCRRRLQKYRIELNCNSQQCVICI